MVSVAKVDSPLGCFAVAVEDGEVLAVELPGGGDRGEQASALAAGVDPADVATLGRAVQAIGAVTSGQAAPMLPLRLEGTPFQLAVWRALMEVPAGEVVSYGELAARAGYPGAARAVGSAMRANPLPLLVPCHRVVAAKGLGGYAGGVELKRALLAAEGVEVGEQGPRRAPA